MQYSYSRVDLYKRCPYHFKLKYIDGLTELTDYRADNPLLIGSALHKGIETDESTMIDYYYHQYPGLTDEIVNEGIKLSKMLPKVQAWLSQFDGLELIHEYEINTPDYKGFVDLIIRAPDGTVMVIDFKYSNHIKNYKDSGQLHVYQHYLEEQGFKVSKLGFLFVEKVSVKQGKTEDLYHYRKRLEKELSYAKVTFLPIEYDEHKSLEFEWATKAIELETKWQRNPHGECFACMALAAKAKGRWSPLTPPDYLEALQDEKGEIIKIMAKTINKRLWLYGAPFSGKTTFASLFPAPYMINTDGNTTFIDVEDEDVFELKDVVTDTGRTTSRKLAWDSLDEHILEFEKGNLGDYKTLVIDLVEDLYTFARIKSYEDLDIDHEADNNFKAWDYVTTKFLNMIKRINSLPFENIIYISHEDATKDITKRSGDKITSIQPNLREKVATKLAGMVHIVGRVEADGDVRKLVFKSDSYIFTGGRLPGIKVKEIDLDYDELLAVYDSVVIKKTRKPAKDLSDISDVEQVEPVEEPKRSRRKKAEEEVVEEEPEEVKEAPRRRSRKDEEDVVEEEQPTRKRRERKAVDDVPPGEESESEPEEEPAPRRRRRRSRGE